METKSASAPELPSAHDIAKASSGVWTLRGQSHHVQLTRPIAAAPIKILLQIEGKAEMRQGHQHVTLAPQEFMLVDGARPFSLTMDQRFAQILVAIPRATARSIHGDLDQSALSVFGGDGAEAITRDFLLSLAHHAPQLSSAARWRSIVAITSLLAAIVPKKQARPSDSVLRQAMALIEIELPDFDAGMFTSRLGVSRRHLDSLFVQTGRTLSQHVWERRLQLAAGRLHSCDSSSITEIAHAVGFKDSAHFSRSFRQRFGVSPTEWRRSPGAL